jgi:ABC-type enterochelin transport system permease subunit
LGGIHGAYQVISEVIKKPKADLENKMKIKTDCFSWRLLQTMSTFLLVVFAWIFFLSDTITDALCFMKRIVVKPTPWLWFNGGIFELGLDRVEMNILVVATLILILVDWIRYKKKQTLDVFLLEQNLWFEWGVIIGLIVMIFIFGEYGPTYDPQQFIYFQF